MSLYISSSEEEESNEPPVAMETDGSSKPSVYGMCVLHIFFISNLIFRVANDFQEFSPKESFLWILNQRHFVNFNILSFCEFLPHFP